LNDLAVPRRRQRPRPLSANTFWVGRRDDGNAGPTQRLDCILRTAGNGAEPKPISVLGGIRFCPIPLNKSWFEVLRRRGSEVATMFVSGASPQVAEVGVGIGISMAILRRFWAVAARWNSSRAPFGPRNRSRSSFRMRLRWANSISTFLRSRLEVR